MAVNGIGDRGSGGGLYGAWHRFAVFLWCQAPFFAYSATPMVPGTVFTRMVPGTVFTVFKTKNLTPEKNNLTKI